MILFSLILYMVVTSFHATSAGCAQNMTVANEMKNIFLSQNIGYSNGTILIENAKRSFTFLNIFQNLPDNEIKLRFVLNNSNYLIKLFDHLKTRCIHNIHELFIEFNDYLKHSITDTNMTTVDVKEIKKVCESLIISSERLLAFTTNYNTSDDCCYIPDILSMNDTSLYEFFKNKFEVDHSQMGYFFLEVFYTLVGMSWKIISTLLHVSDLISETFDSDC